MYSSAKAAKFSSQHLTPAMSFSLLRTHSLKEYSYTKENMSLDIAFYVKIRRIFFLLTWPEAFGGG
jgi:hypothetical protein